MVEDLKRLGHFTSKEKFCSTVKRMLLSAGFQSSRNKNCQSKIRFFERYTSRRWLSSSRQSCRGSTTPARQWSGSRISSHNISVFLPLNKCKKIIFLDPFFFYPKYVYLHELFSNFDARKRCVVLKNNGFNFASIESE